VVKIFKEKYYIHSTYLDASLGRNPSYAWQSIWSAKPLLREGMVWKVVGDRHSIHIWGDKWLPTKVTHVVQSPMWVLDEDAKVCALIDEDTR
jgi:hypothetical protein